MPRPATCSPALAALPSPQEALAEWQSHFPGEDLGRAVRCDSMTMLLDAFLLSGVPGGLSGRRYCDAY